MTVNFKHRISAILMWSSVGIAGISALGILAKYAIPGITLFIVFSISAVISGLYKKKYCSRCRKNSTCENPTQEDLK